MEKINITTGPGVLEIRQGDAMPLHEVKGYEISGDVAAPHEYYKKRKPKKDVTLLLVDYLDGKLKLKIDMHIDAEKIVIGGQIQSDPLLGKLGINTTAKYTAKQLADLIKANRMMLHEDSEPDWKTLVKELTKFRAEVKTMIEAADDDRGNTKHSIERMLDTDVPESFTIEWPIIKNGPKLKFEVGVFAEVRDRSVSFWLDSVELKELMIENAKKMIDAEVKKFNDEIVIIYQ